MARKPLVQDVQTQLRALRNDLSLSLSGDDAYSLARALRDEAAEMMRLASTLDDAIGPEAAETFWGANVDFFRSPSALKRGENTPAGSELCPGLKLFHDAEDAEFHWWQRPLGPRVGGHYALVATVYRFPGSFLSLAIDVPAKDLPRMMSEPSVSLAFKATATRPLKLYCRLNLYRDGAHEVLHDAMIIKDGSYRARFALDQLSMTLRDGTSAWVDMILARPAMTEIEFSALRLATDEGEPQ